MKIIFAALVLLGLSGCATGTSRNGTGFIYTDVKDSIVATTNTAATKKGESCATNVLSIASTGDMSLETAKRVSGISKVSAVDYSQFSVLGIFAKTCIIVTGE